MSQTQATKPIYKGNNSIIRFLENITSESLQAKASAIIPIQVEDAPRAIQAIPLSIVSAYWLMQAGSGNKYAEALAYACIAESLERRCDTVFKATKTEDEYESKAEVNYQHYWQSSRTFSKRCHVAFSHACWLLANN